MFVAHVTFLTAVSGSDFQSLVEGVPVWPAQHTSAPSDPGGCASCFILAARLSFDARGFQTISASAFYIHTNLQWSPDVYSTIVRVLHAVPIPAHCTAVVLVLHFQICPRIHPLLSVHHMLAVPWPLLSCNAVI